MHIFDTALTYTYYLGFEVSAHGSDMSLSALSLRYVMAYVIQYVIGVFYHPTLMYVIMICHTHMSLKHAPL